MVLMMVNGLYTAQKTHRLHIFTILSWFRFKRFDSTVICSSFTLFSGYMHGFFSRLSVRSLERAGGPVGRASPVLVLRMLVPDKGPRLKFLPNNKICRRSVLLLFYRCSAVLSFKLNLIFSPHTLTHTLYTLSCPSLTSHCSGSNSLINVVLLLSCHFLFHLHQTISCRRHAGENPQLRAI